MGIGRLEESSFLTVPHVHKLFLYNHITFFISYNRNKIIAVNASTGTRTLSLNKEAPFSIEYTYSVEWLPSNVSPDKRLSLLKDYSFFPRTLEIHWLSVILISLLMAFIVVILTRVLRTDFSRYNKVDA